MLNLVKIGQVNDPINIITKLITIEELNSLPVSSELEPKHNALCGYDFTLIVLIKSFF